VSAKHWWDADHPPRVFAEAILSMDDKERQRSFFDTHVPDHLKELVMSHVKTAIALGGNR
jgi:hypothetical protein